MIIWEQRGSDQDLKSPRRGNTGGVQCTQGPGEVWRTSRGELLEWARKKKWRSCMVQRYEGLWRACSGFAQSNSVHVRLRWSLMICPREPNGQCVMRSLLPRLDYSYSPIPHTPHFQRSCLVTCGNKRHETHSLVVVKIHTPATDLMKPIPKARTPQHGLR
jgi:hypothetical protein